uniref:Lipooligosaccharide biosynthesis protein n=1 Tax=Histophilus somni (strain 129Pt) TaxID=205914 RepID=Q0I2Z6_HISS1
MFNYVISLKSAVDRRQHIEKEFSQQHIPYTFFDAFQLNEENKHILQHYVPSLNKTDLTTGEKGCFMSLTVENTFPIDEIIFNQILNHKKYKIYQLNPAILIQELTLHKEKSILQSDLETERKKVRDSKKIKRNFCEKVKYKISRYKNKKREKIIRKEK